MNHQVALITGGSEGIGFACAQRLYEAGYDLCLLSRNEKKLEAAAEALGGRRGRVLLFPCDVAVKESVGEAVQKAAEGYGRIDVLIHSAGCSMRAPCPFEDISEEEYTRILHTNTDGLFWSAQAALPIMKRQENGHILAILSTAAHAAGPENGPYSASKSAAKALCDTLIQECRGTGIRISSISPGPVATTIWSHKQKPPGEEQMQRMLRPEDIARIADFLLSSPLNVHIGDILVTPWIY